MSLRTNFFIIVGVVVAFIIFVVITLSKSGGNMVTTELPSPVSPVTAVPSEPSSPALPSKVVTAPAVVSVSSPVDVLVLARSFAERFGSFSNQSNFENLEELRSLMTPTMQAWTDRFIAEERVKIAPNTPYYGVTTRTVETNVSGFDEARGEGTVLVRTQRREVKGKEMPRMFAQDLLLTWKKVGEEWKVERATWK